MEQQLPDDEFNLRQYLAVLVKRRWTLIACAALIFLTAAVWTFRATPFYRAMATVVIERENPNLVSFEEVLRVDSGSSEYYQTQFQIIQSRAVARKVVRQLNLADSEEFNPPPADHFLARGVAAARATLADWKARLAELLPARAGAVQEAAEAATEPDAAVIGAFQSRVVVEPVRNSRMVRIGVEAADRAMAARMANALVAAYIDHTLETKLGAAREAVNWLSERIAEERLKVEQAELQLLAFKEAHGIAGEYSEGVGMVIAQQLAEMETQYLVARTLRVEAETRYQQALSLARAPGGLDAIPQVVSDDLVNQIKRTEIELYNRLSEYSGIYGANHPRIRAVQASLAELESRKQQEVDRIMRALQNEFRLGLVREETLEKALREQRAANMELSKRTVEMTVLQRQAESARQMYEVLFNRFKETSLTEDMHTGNVRIVDLAEVPGSPVRPDKRRNLALALTVGLMAGVGLCFLIEYLDNSIKLPDEVRDRLGLAYLGPVPAVSDMNNPTESLVAFKAPKSAAAEAIRGVRTAIQFSSAEAAPRVLQVISAERAEGKTFMACNLAVALAQAGKRVALLDCDMRKPTLHRVFELSREVGLSNLLTGTAALGSVLQPTSIAGLFVAVCGPVPPNPGELLGSQRMVDLLRVLRDKFDHVVIDTPPLSAVADAAVLATRVDGSVVVIRAASTPRPLIQGVLARLQAMQAPLVGAVLNGVAMGRGNYYYYQNYYYYYGDDESALHRRKQRRKAEESVD